MLGTVLLTINWLMRCLKNKLIKRQIKPTAKFETSLPDCASMAKSKSLMKCHACMITLVNATNHDVILLLHSLGNELLHECRPNAFASVIFVNINRMLDRVFIRRPRTKNTIARKAEKFT